MSKRRKQSKKYRRREREDEVLPSRLPLEEGERLVKVYVEGYDDVAFWRGIFNDFETRRLTFEIAVPPRPDLAKGKKVVMDMIRQNSPETLLCVDSDFDYLFDGYTSQSRKVMDTPSLFHTYTYATENYLCSRRRSIPSAPRPRKTTYGYSISSVSSKNIRASSIPSSSGTLIRRGSATNTSSRCSISKTRSS